MQLDQLVAKYITKEEARTEYRVVNGEGRRLFADCDCVTRKDADFHANCERNIDPTVHVVEVQKWPSYVGDVGRCVELLEAWRVRLRLNARVDIQCDSYSARPIYHVSLRYIKPRSPVATKIAMGIGANTLSVAILDALLQAHDVPADEIKAAIEADEKELAGGGA